MDMVKINKKVKFLKGVIFFMLLYTSDTQHAAMDPQAQFGAQNLFGEVDMEQFGEKMGFRSIAKSTSLMYRTFAYTSVVLTFGVLAYIFRPVLVDLYRFIKKFFLKIYKKIFFKSSRSFKMFNDKEMVHLENDIDNVLNSIVGHEEAKKKLKDILIRDTVRKFKNKKFKFGANVASIFEIYGRAGIGKSEFTNNLCKVLCKGKEPFRVTAAMIDQKSKRTVVDQLLFSDEKNIYLSDLYYYIKAVPYGCVIFDEFDKFWNLDPVGLTEFFRGILDLGYISVRGENLNCKDLSFFLTFNKYGTGGIIHDESYLSRIQLIQFGNLTVDDVIEITKRKLSSMNESFLEKYGVSLVYDDGFLEQIGNGIQQQCKGYRPGNMLLDSLSSRVFLLWVKNNYKPLNEELSLRYSDDFISFTATKKKPKDENKPDSSNTIAA